MSFTDQAFYELSGAAFSKAKEYFAEFDSRRKLRREFAAKHGCADVLLRTGGGDARVVGVASPLNGKAPTTLGWKPDKRNAAYFYVDRRKRKRADELDREMAALCDPGVPFGEWHFVGSTFYIPTLLRLDGKIFYRHRKDAKVPEGVAACTLWRNSDILRIIEACELAKAANV